MGDLMLAPTTHLSICPNPFTADRIDLELPAGETLADMMRAAGTEPDTISHALVFIDDWLVPRAHWAVVRPKPGRIVTVRVVPMGGGGGGKSPLRIVLAIAVIAAAAWAGAALGPIVGASLFGPGTALGLSAATAAALGQGLVAGAVTLLGNLAVNAIAPPPKPSLGALSGRFDGERTSPTLSITGTQNRANPYGPVPRVFGKCRLFPPYAAVPYSEVIGNDQYLRLLFECGYGPLVLSDFRIGTTPLSQFEGVETQVRTGEAGDPDITLYANTVHEDGYSLQLTAAGGPRTLESRGLADEITIDLVFPTGLVSFDANANRNPLTVEVLVEYRLAGSGGGFTSAGVQTITGATEQVVRFGVRIVLPARGRYEVRFTRQTADFTAVNQRGDSFVSILRSITYTPPALPAGSSTIAMRIKATNQLNGVVGTFNLQAEAKLAIWNGSSFDAPALTRSVAWAALDVLRGSANKKPVADSRIDLASFKALADNGALATLNGQARYLFDAAIDFRSTVGQLAREILATARADLTMKNGKWAVVMDRPQATPVQMLTPRNSANFRGTKLFVQRPHALKARFLNPDKGPGQDEVVVYDGGYNAGNATLFETVELFGVNRAAQAYADARLMIAEAKLRPETYELETDIENLVCARGDLIKVGHDVPRWGLGAGRIKARTVDGSSNVTSIMLDERVTLEAGKSYVARVRRSDGSQVLGTIASVGVTTETQTLALSPSIAAASAPAVGDLVQVGETGRETVDLLVKAIRYTGLHAVLELVDAAPAIFTADTLPIPPFDTGSTFPGQGVNLDPPRPKIEDVRSDEDAMVLAPGGGWEPAIRITIARLSGIAFDIEHLEVQLRRTGSGDPFEPQIFKGQPPVVYVTGVDELQAYDLRLRHVTVPGRVSDWTPIDGHVVQGKTAPPAAPSGLTVAAGLLTWTYGLAPRDFAGFEVLWKFGDDRNPAGATAAHVGLVGAPPFDLSTLPGGTLTLFVFAVDSSGNRSTEPAILVKDLGDPAQANVVETIDLEALGWPGTTTGGSISGDDIVASSLTLFWSNDAALFWSVDSAPFWPAGVYDTLVYETSFAIDALWAPADIFLELATAGGSPMVEYRRSEGLFWSNDANVFWSGDPNPFWQASGDWRPWPGRINVGREQIDLRVTLPGGPVQGVLDALRIVVDVPDVREQFLDLALPSTASRITPLKAYRAIKTVRFDLLDDGGSAVNVRIIDRDPVLGPLVQPVDAALAGATAHVNATIEGY